MSLERGLGARGWGLEFSPFLNLRALTLTARRPTDVGQGRSARLRVDLANEPAGRLLELQPAPAPRRFFNAELLRSLTLTARLMSFAFNAWKDRHDMDRANKLRELLAQRRRERQASPERERRDERRERRQKIVDRLAALIGIAGGHFTGANWVGKATALFILSCAAAAVKWILSQ